MYFVAGPSPTSSDLWFYVYAQDFGPGDLCKWYARISLPVCSLDPRSALLGGFGTEAWLLLD